MANWTYFYNGDGELEHCERGARSRDVSVVNVFLIGVIGLIIVGAIAASV